ncbi:MAG: hypothetical protein R3B72_05930 [Polyangiaceae bacterium]
MNASDRRNLRLAMLRFVYEASQGDPHRFVTAQQWASAAQRVGADYAETNGAMNYLHQQGLLQRRSLDGHYTITPHGIDFVEDEELDARPELAIPAVNITNIHAPTGSVQIGGSGNTANVQQAIHLPDDLTTQIAELRAAVEAIEDRQQARDAAEALALLEEQATRDTPNSTMVKATGEALKEHLPDMVPTIIALVSYVVGKATGQIP